MGIRPVARKAKAGGLGARQLSNVAHGAAHSGITGVLGLSGWSFKRVNGKSPIKYAL